MVSFRLHNRIPTLPVASYRNALPLRRRRIAVIFTVRDDSPVSLRRNRSIFRENAYRIRCTPSLQSSPERLQVSLYKKTASARRTGPMSGTRNAGKLSTSMPPFLVKKKPRFDESYRSPFFLPFGFQAVKITLDGRTPNAWSDSAPGRRRVVVPLHGTRRLNPGSAKVKNFLRPCGFRGEP